MRPSDPEEEKRPDRTIDWITFKFFQSNSRALSAHVKTIRGGSSNRTSCYAKHKPTDSSIIDRDKDHIPADNFYPPSDHMPVIAVFEIFPPEI